MRLLAYPGTDLVLMCFSVANPDSFNEILWKWIPEIRQHLASVPFVLVGLKSDLRDNPVFNKLYVEPFFTYTIRLMTKDKKFVSRMEAEALAKKEDAICYVECSSKYQWHTRDVIKAAFIGMFSDYKRNAKAMKNKKDCQVQ